MTSDFRISRVFGLLAAWDLLFLLRAISPSLSSFTLEFNNRILETTTTDRKSINDYDQD